MALARFSKAMTAWNAALSIWAELLPWAPTYQYRQQLEIKSFSSPFSIMRQPYHQKQVLSFRSISYDEICQLLDLDSLIIALVTIFFPYLYAFASYEYMPVSSLIIYFIYVKYVPYYSTFVRISMAVSQQQPLRIVRPRFNFKDKTSKHALSDIIPGCLCT